MVQESAQRHSSIVFALNRFLLLFWRDWSVSINRYSSKLELLCIWIHLSLFFAKIKTTYPDGYSHHLKSQ